MGSHRSKRWVLVAFGWIAINAANVYGQELPPFHITLASWEDAVWLDLLDRNNSIGGRNSDLGVLKRWNEEIDRKYLLDLFILAPNQTEDYRWTQRKNAFRWMSGSINRRDLATFATFKSEVGIGEKWDFGVRLDMVRIPRAKRTALRFFTGRRLTESLRLTARVHLDPEKPGSDIGLSLQWSRENANAALEFWVLDVFNDLIHVTFDAAGQPQIQFTEDYLTQAVAVRGSADIEVTTGLRIEGYGALLPTSRLRVTERTDPTFGFTNTEDIWYGAILLEWKPTKRLLISTFGTNRKSTSSKIWEHQSNSVFDYGLDERTTRFGATTIYRPKQRMELSLQGQRVWRPEVRIAPTSGDTLVEYTLESWLAAAGGRYQTRGTAFFDLWLAYQKSDEPLGTGQVPSAGSLAASQFRLAVDVGWWLDPAIWFSIGIAQDFGSDKSGGGFGGARGRGVLNW